jgi:hypothetical protein
MSIIRPLVAIFVLARILVSLASILLDGASTLLEGAAFAIALVGLALVGLVIGGMGSAGRPSLVAHRAMDRRSCRPVTAR